MKKLLNIIIGLVLSIGIFGQDQQYSHNMFNQMAVNPGYAGSSDMIGITALNRNQWINVPKETGAPFDQVFTVNAPINLFDKAWGTGISLVNNTYAADKDLGLKASFAYQHKVEIGDGKVGFGLSLGFLNVNLDGSKLHPEVSGDDHIYTGSTPKVTFDWGAGVYYKTEKVYLGVSLDHPFNQNVNFISSGSTTLATGAYYLSRTIYVTSGYYYQLPSNPMYQLAPSVFIQYGGGTTVVTANTNIIYNNRTWGGLSVRSTGDITFLFGLELMTGIKFGAAYDLSAGQVGAISHNSFEVIVMYNFKLKKEKIPQRYKSIRFL